MFNTIYVNNNKYSMKKMNLSDIYTVDINNLFIGIETDTTHYVGYKKKRFCIEEGNYKLCWRHCVL